MIKKALSTILILAMAISMLPSAIKTAEVQAASNGWNLVWSDEFDGDSLSRDNWNVEVNGFGGGNEELQYYCDRPENIDVSNGTLKIIARKEYYEEKDYTSARLNTLHKVDFGYGKIEAKIKLPKFKGAFPAFWMLGSNFDTVGYPACGEIDIVETINDQSIPYCTAHWPYGSSIKSSGSNLSDVGESIDTSEWHTYTMIRNEKEIVWYVDDILVHKVDLASSPEREALTKDMQILLNFAVGGLWPGFDIDDSALPASMEVDYIRFYERDSDYVPVYEKEDSVQLYDGTWENEVASWSAAEGKIISTDNPADGFTADITKIGNSEWGVQASLRNLDYRRGNTYTFSCTLLSDIDKYVFIKVQGDGTSTLAGEYVHLTANEPYNYETTVTLAYEYRGTVSLYFAMGGNANEETIDRHSPMKLRVSDVSFYTLIEKESEEIEASVTLDGFQISTYANGFRTIYSIESNTDDIVESGVVYGIGEVPSEDINQLLCKILKKEGYEVIPAYSGTEAKLRLEQDIPDLILLDLMLPGMKGEEITEYLRKEKNSNVPIIVLSAKMALENKVELITMGADDYITKPFEPQEVLVRVMAALRRIGMTGSTKQQNYSYKNLVLNPVSRKITVNEKEIALTPHEYEILFIMLQQPEKVFSRDALYEKVWSSGYWGEDNTVNVHVSNIRKKIAAADKDEEYIKTVWGIGFKMA